MKLTPKAAKLMLGSSLAAGADRAVGAGRHDPLLDYRGTARASGQAAGDGGPVQRGNRHHGRSDPGHRKRSGHPRHRRLCGRRSAGCGLSHAAIRSALGRGGHSGYRSRNRSDRGTGHGHLRPRRALAMAAFNGETASVPVDGWTQMVVYRKDLFDEAGLEAPNSFGNVLAALEALHNPPEMYGFVAATKVDENFMSQVSGACLPRQWRQPGQPRRLPAAGRGQNHRSSGFLQGDRQGLASGRTVLEAVARAVFRRQGGDDHLVAVHSGRAGRPA